VIANNQHQIKKDVWTHNDIGEKIRLVRTLSDNEEGVQVAQSIFDTKINEQWRNRDFAILYRTNAQSRAMEEALRKMNIPYRIYGGLSFYKRKEIKDLLAYFRLTINPHDEEALKRIINVPARGIGKTTIEKLTVVSAEHEKSIWDIITTEIQLTGLNHGIALKVTDFATMIRSFQVKLKTDSAYDLASHIASSTGMLRELYSDKTPEGLSRYENIQELLNGIKEFTETGRSITPRGDEDAFGEPEVRTLDMFMQDISLLTDADEEEEQNNDTVSLMTIHAAKGLEFPAVFVVGLEENLFPSQLSVGSREDLEEERRLFYVAITRAQKKLTLSYANTRYRWGTLVNSEPSRFVEEIRQECMEEVSPRSRDAFVFDQEVSEKRWTGSSSRPKSQPQVTISQPVPPKMKNVNSTEIRNFVGDDTSQIQAGMEVEHPRFGIGKVMLVEGKPNDLKATIFFNGLGNKQLLLKFAKLKILGGSGN
jgi:DNA helicase-2/ATP-dependent DNA helicase PcrA